MISILDLYLESLPTSKTSIFFFLLTLIPILPKFGRSTLFSGVSQVSMIVNITDFESVIIERLSECLLEVIWY